MKRAFITCSLLLGAMLSAQAATSAADHPIKSLQNPAVTKVAVQHTPRKSGHVRKPKSNSGVVTYDHDSKNPNVGWHWQGGLRVCTQDCDNPEIPGSGFTCRNVQMFGMNWRECDETN